MRRALGVLGSLLLVLMVGSACAPPTSLAPTVVVPSLDHPWDIAFAPDSTMLFTQRPGPIDALVDGQVHQLGWPSDVVAVNEGGMMGLAVAPDFPTSREIFTCMLSNRSGAYDVRVVRWRVDSSYTTLTDRADIVTGIPVNTQGQTGRHSGCRPRFGPDGYLWVTTGDSATGSVPQDKQSLGGKVLRVTRDGSGAPGNPGGAFRPEIYTYGHRNPQGVAFRASDGQAFSIEHGTDCDDEVNRLVPGGNYGWDPVAPGGGSTYDESRPMTDFVKFPAAVAAVWSSGCPTIAPSGGTFIDSPEWLGWNGTLAVAVLKGNQLRLLQVAADGLSVTGQWVAATDQGRLRVAVQGPDGDLYIAVDAGPGSGGSIRRLHPNG